MIRVRGNGCKRGAGVDPAWPPPDTEEAARGELECPCCGYVGRMTLWGHYTRCLVHLDGEWTGDPNSVEAREEVVRVRRVRCPGCLRTHALLWEGVLEYSPFSERTLLIGLLAALLTAPDGTRGSRLKRTCEAVHASRTTLRTAPLTPLARIAVLLASHALALLCLAVAFPPRRGRAARLPGGGGLPCGPLRKLLDNLSTAYEKGPPT